MTYLLLIFVVIDIVQGIYIKWLKKEICLRDGTYKPKPSRSSELFRRKHDKK